jgi:NitT/TauT family transport system ATP-binding protein
VEDVEQSRQTEDQSLFTEADEVISIQNVYKSFAHPSGELVNVLSGINLVVRQQEFFSIIGPSGCGKSTIFNIIAGLIEPNSGKVLVNCQEVSKSIGHVGYMMQKDLLLPWRTVIDNVTLGLEIQNMPKQDRYNLGMEYLKKYSLESFSNSYPSMLSGGMRQRVALIRTLVTDLDVILLDEPFSALDYQTRLVLEDEILSILKKENKTCVLITHDIEEAIALSDRVAVMSKRPTSVKQVYDVKLASKYGSVMQARTDANFKNFFNQIWSELDIQMGGAVNG